MSFNSSLSALICNIKICIKHHKLKNRCRYSKLNVAIILKLIEDGSLKSYKVQNLQNGFKEIEFEINNIDGENILQDIKQVSKPGQRIYMKPKEIRKLLCFYDNAIVSTNMGLLGYDDCIKHNIGGEVLLIYR